jgi:hypothetical protein
LREFKVSHYLTLFSLSVNAVPPTYAKELRPRVFTLEHRIDETGITLCLGDQIQSA